MSTHSIGAGIILSGRCNVSEGNLDKDSQSNRYEKRDMINESLYGGIYLGLDTATNQEVIIKSSWRSLALAKRLRNGSSSNEDIMEEIRILKMLSTDKEPCPYIIKLLDVQSKVNSIDMILERAEGGELWKFIEDKTARLNRELERLKGTEEYQQLLHEHWDEVLKIMKQILRATAYLHSRNICHRDLSLENIVLDSDGNIRLIDFGSVKEYVDGNWLSENGPVGKPAYQSPECYASKKYDGRDNDMWCNGVILWQMLLGSPPWITPDNSDARFRLIYEDGLAGIERILNVWKCSDRLPPYCSDFLLKIFCPQKCRITVWDALVHPYITSGAVNEDFHLRRVPVQLPARPDHQLERLAHFTRHCRVNTPSVWIEMSQEKRQRVMKLISRIIEDRELNVLDLRVLNNIAREENIQLEDARLIVHYLWTASEHPNRVSFLKQKECHHDYHTCKSDPESSKYGVDVAEDCKSGVGVSEKGNFDSDMSMYGSSSESDCSIKLVDIREDRKVNFDYNVEKTHSADLSSANVTYQKRDTEVSKKVAPDLWQEHERAAALRNRRSFPSHRDERPSIVGRAKKSIKNVLKQKVGWVKWNTSSDNALEFIPESGVPTTNARFRALSEGKIYEKKCRQTLVAGRPRGRSAIKEGYFKRAKQLRTKSSHRDIEEKSTSSALALQEFKFKCNALEMTLSPKVHRNSATNSDSASFWRIAKKEARSQSYDGQTPSQIISSIERPSRRGCTFGESKSGCDSEPEQLPENFSRDGPSFICILNSAQTPRPAERRAHFGSDEPNFSSFQSLEQTPRTAERRENGIVSLVTSAIV